MNVAGKERCFQGGGGLIPRERKVGNRWGKEKEIKKQTTERRKRKKKRDHK